MLICRKRGKHGPESRIAPMEESAISEAIRTATSGAGEPVFIPVVGMEFNLSYYKNVTWTRLPLAPPVKFCADMWPTLP